jgi:hypothetical protein
VEMSAGDRCPDIVRTPRCRAERGHGATVDNVLEGVSGRGASGEDKWTRGYDVG